MSFNPLSLHTIKQTLNSSDKLQTLGARDGVLA
jgi:hypothetical protein